MSRPVGSKNKKTQIIPLTKKKGRPAGSKNIDDVAKLSCYVKCGDPVKTYNDVQFFNCTGHDITVRGVGKVPVHSFLRIPEQSYIKGYVQGVPIYDVSYAVGMLPEPEKNKIYIVGQIVCIAAAHRGDLYMPYRVDHKGPDKSCIGLIQNPFYKANKAYCAKMGIEFIS